VRTDADRQDLQHDAWQPGGVDQPLELLAHHFLAADRPPQRRLVHHRL
jgi:hypothetical protein